MAAIAGNNLHKITSPVERSRVDAVATYSRIPIALMVAACNDTVSAALVLHGNSHCIVRFHNAFDGRRARFFELLRERYPVRLCRTVAELRGVREQALRALLLLNSEVDDKHFDGAPWGILKSYCRRTHPVSD